PQAPCCRRRINFPGPATLSLAAVDPEPAAALELDRASIKAGRPWPLGVEWIESEDSFNFALYSRHATGVTLLCYLDDDAVRPSFAFRFEHPAFKTGNIWHARIP